LMEATMRTRSVFWGLSSLLRIRLMSLMHRSVSNPYAFVWRRYERLADKRRWLLDSSVRHALQLRTRAQTMFWAPWSIWDVPRAENLFFKHTPGSRGMTPSTSYIAVRWRRTAPLVSMYSERLSTSITWSKWELDFRIKWWLIEFSSHYH
jgi:hypothetical protein